MMRDIDQVVQAAFNARAVPGYGLFFQTITHLGSAYAWIAVLSACVLIGQWRKIAAILIIALAFGMILNEDLKGIVQRIRPENVKIGGYFTFYNYSFPSGHAETAFIMATVLAAFIPMRYNLITYLLAIGVGLSRLYIGVHYFTDIVAGAATGIVIGILTVLILYRTRLANENIMTSRICNTLHIPMTTPLSWSDIMDGLVMIAIGLTLAIALLLLRQYILSMALLFFVYVRLWWGTRPYRRTATDL